MSPSITSAPLPRLSPLLALAFAATTAMPAAAQTTPAPSVPRSLPPSVSPAAGATGTVALTYDSCSDLPASQLLTLGIRAEGFSDGGRVSFGETATTRVPPGTYEVQVRGGSGDALRGGVAQVDVASGGTTSLRSSMLCGPPVEPATDVSIPQEEGLAHSTVRVVYDTCPAYPGHPLGVSLEGTTDEGDDVDLAGRTLRPGDVVTFTVIGGSYTLTSDIEGVGLYGTAAVAVSDDEAVVLDTALLCTVDDDDASDVPVPTRIETGWAAGSTAGTGGEPAAATAAAAAAALAGAGGILVARRGVAPVVSHVPAGVRHRAAALAAAALVAGAAACGVADGPRAASPTATTSTSAIAATAATPPTATADTAGASAGTSASAVPQAGPHDIRAPRTIEAAPVDVALPVRVVIPAIGVDSAVVDAGLRSDGQLDVPDPGFAGWYTEGPRPGEPGPAVVVAHVSTRQGPDVFVDLHRLAPGDVVDVVRADGTTGRWQVRSSEQTAKEDLPAERIWNSTARPVLRLVTCGGVVRPDGHYSDNVIVYADPVRP